MRTVAATSRGSAWGRMGLRRTGTNRITLATGTVDLADGVALSGAGGLGRAAGPACTVRGASETFSTAMPVHATGRPAPTHVALPGARLVADLLARSRQRTVRNRLPRSVIAEYRSLPC